MVDLFFELLEWLVQRFFDLLNWGYYHLKPILIILLVCLLLGGGLITGYNTHGFGIIKPVLSPTSTQVVAVHTATATPTTIPLLPTVTPTPTGCADYNFLSPLPHYGTYTISYTADYNQVIYAAGGEITVTDSVRGETKTWHNSFVQIEIYNDPPNFQKDTFTVSVTGGFVYPPTAESTQINYSELLLAFAKSKGMPLQSSFVLSCAYPNILVTDIEDNFSAR